MHNAHKRKTSMLSTSLELHIDHIGRLSRLHSQLKDHWSNMSNRMLLISCPADHLLLTLFQGCDATPSTIDATATVTSCATSCTSIITYTEPFGCAFIAAGQTTTSTISCGGCVLSTTSVVNELLGVGPVCFNGRKTITDDALTATATACSV